MVGVLLVREPSYCRYTHVRLFHSVCLKGAYCHAFSPSIPVCRNRCQLKHSLKRCRMRWLTGLYADSRTVLCSCVHFKRGVLAVAVWQVCATVASACEAVTHKGRGLTFQQLFLSGCTSAMRLRECPDGQVKLSKRLEPDVSTAELKQPTW